MKESITTLDKVSEVYNGNSINAEYKRKYFCGLDEGYPFIATKDIAMNGIVDYDNGVKIPYGTKYKIAEPNSVFICAEGGSAGRKIAFIDRKVCFGNKLFCIKPNSESLLGKYVYYYTNSDGFQTQFKKLLAGLIGGVSISKFKSISIPLPPLAEQRKIVDFLDTQFRNIDALKNNAERSMTEAKNALNNAISECTAYEPNWEQKKLKDICTICGEYGLNESATTYNGVRYLRITDITADGELNDDLVSANGNNEQKKLIEGDILFARTGATVGKSLVYSERFGNCVFAGYLIRYRTNPEIILPRYLFYITHSSNYYDWVKKNQASAAQPNISAQKYNNLIINYPKSIQEQQCIVDKLDGLYYRFKQLNANYTQTLTLCNDLKQALLKQIFD